MLIEVIGIEDVFIVNSLLSGFCKEYWVVNFLVIRKLFSEINSSVSFFINRL